MAEGSQFDWIALLGNVLLFALVFGMSATVDIRCMLKQIGNVRALFTGIFCQFVLLPLLGFAAVKCFNLDYGTGLTLLVVTSSPGGSYSNWWCSLFNADLALSVTMTAISTILSTIMLPSNLLLYTHLAFRHRANNQATDGTTIIEKLEWSSIVVALVIVITAIGIGLCCSAMCQSKIRNFSRIANHCGNVAGFVLVVFSATLASTGSPTSSADGEDAAAAQQETNDTLWSRPWTFYVAITFPCLGGLILANLIAFAFELPRPEQVTVAIECCYQNVGIATSLALSMFDGNALKDAMAVPFLYGMVEAFLVGLYCVIAWKLGWTKAPADANFCKVIVTSYEVLEYERRDLDSIEVTVSESDERIADEMNAEGNTLTTYFYHAFTGPCGKDLASNDVVRSTSTGMEINTNQMQQNSNPLLTKETKFGNQSGELA